LSLFAKPEKEKHLNYARFSLPAIIFAGFAWGQKPSTASAPTLASTVDRDITSVEKQIFEIAEAMPEEKYNFLAREPEHSGQRLPGRSHVCPATETCRRFDGIEHSTEHFGQLVVYYRANNLVPPESCR
jgi:hypothetical protein